jgi:MoaA/NifB/PqqE/SkfB family radical SAM enzyme
MNLTDKKIIRVEPTNPAFAVNWNIGLRCNFDCMYCPDMYHNLVDPHLTLKEMQNRWIEIVNKTKHIQLKYKLIFTGGEVTINKDFIRFLDWLNENYKDQISECGFTSNGSANKKYYLETIELPIITFISLSTHSEFFNENKFFNLVVELNKKAKKLNKSIHVNVMEEFWHQERIKTYCDFLISNNINHSVNKIFYEHKIREEPKFNKNLRMYKFD